MKWSLWHWSKWQKMRDLTSRSRKFHVNQRKLLWSIRTQNFFLSFVHKIIPRYLSVVQVLLSFSAHIDVTRGTQGAMPPQIFNIFNHFVIWEAVSQTKYCCSPTIKIFAPLPNLTPPVFWAGYALTAPSIFIVLPLCERKYE